MKNQNDLVSIVVPVFKAETFIYSTIRTVQDQTYENWELLLVDDKSPDESIKIIRQLQATDKRIKLLRMNKNSGAALSRNKGILEANGRYIAFLDADDLWDNEKLEKQVVFMHKKEALFSFTAYEFANANGQPNGKKVFIPSLLSYGQALKNTTIWTSTVMLDLKGLSKEDIYMPDVRRGQDTATWWKILKSIDHADGLNEVLSFYRRTNDSLSANKLKALKRTWHLYRNVENLSLIKSVYNFLWYCFNAVRRRV